MRSEYTCIVAVGIAVLSALQVAAQGISPAKTKELPGGVTVQTLSNGNSVKFFPYGKAAFGNATLIFPNGRTITGTYTILATGERNASFGNGNFIDILPEGTTTLSLSNGYKAELFQNGLATLFSGNGAETVQSKNLPNGDKMLMLDGGNNVEIAPNGKAVLILPSGEKVGDNFNVSPDGTSYVTNPNGTTITRYPNGKEVVTLKNHVDIVQSLDGTVVMRGITWPGPESSELSPGLSSKLYIPGHVLLNVPDSWIFKDSPASEHVIISAECFYMTSAIVAFVPYDGKNGDGLPQIERAYSTDLMIRPTPSAYSQPGSPLVELIKENCK